MAARKICGSTARSNNLKSMNLLNPNLKIKCIFCQATVHPTTPTNTRTNSKSVQSILGRRNDIHNNIWFARRQWESQLLLRIPAVVRPSLRFCVNWISPPARAPPPSAPRCAARCEFPLQDKQPRCDRRAQRRLHWTDGRVPDGVGQGMQRGGEEYQ